MLNSSDRSKMSNETNEQVEVLSVDEIIERYWDKKNFPVIRSLNVENVSTKLLLDNARSRRISK